MQEPSQKGITISFQITIPEITPKQLQFDPDPESGLDRHELGRGGVGVVYAGHYEDQPVAIKTLYVTTESVVSALHKEAALMFRLTSPYTVRLKGICSAAQKTSLVMERMSGGSLFHLLQDKKQELPWSLRYRLAYEIAEGLWVLHSQEILHRDLKSLNVLLDQEQHAKITDFGFSKVRGQISSVSASSKHSVGTPAYKAPEIVLADNESDSDDDAKAVAPKKNPYSPYSDMYAYGVILWELATRQIPFEGLSARKIEKRISTGKTEKIPADCPPEFTALIQACWAMKPGKRPRTDQVVAQTKALYLATQAPAPVAIQPPAADEKQDYIPAPWHMDPATKAAAGAVQNYARLPAGAEDMAKVVASYQRSPVPGYSIRRVEVIYSPRLNRAFGLDLDLLEARHGNAAFAPKWRNELGPSGQWRRATHAVLETMAAPHQDPAHPHVSLIPMWHATKQEVLDSLFTTGFANLAEVDPGFFGKGIYSAGEAKYSYTVYGKMYQNPALLMNWVATYSAYPVIDGDMAVLQAKANVGNYDAHFIPVRPQNHHDPLETTFIPCAAGGRPYQYTELVVFNPRQCLPRYVVELQSDLLPAPADIQEAAIKAQAEQQQKAQAQQQAEQAVKQQAAQQAAEQAQKQSEITEKEQQKREEIEKAKAVAVQEAVAKAQIKADQEAKAALAKAKQEADQQVKAQAEMAAKQDEKMKQLEAKLAAAEAAAAESGQKSQVEQTQKAKEAVQAATPEEKFPVVQHPVPTWGIDWESVQSRIDLQLLQKLLESEHTGLTQAKGKDLILLLGLSGAGKSTTVNYLKGCEMECDIDESGTPYLKPVVGNQIYAKMGCTLESETLAPNIIPLSGSQYFADCPGFENNRGKEYQICAKVTTQSAIRWSNSVKAAVVLINYPSCIAGSAATFRRLVRELRQMFNDLNTVSPSVLFLVNRAPDRLKPQHVINKIKQLKAAAEKKLENCQSVETPDDHLREILDDTLGRLTFFNLMLSHPDNIMIVNPLDDGTSCALIMKRLATFAPIDRQQFNLPTNNNDHLEFNKLLGLLFEKGTGLLTQIRDLRKNVSDDVAEYQRLTTQILPEAQGRLSDAKTNKNKSVFQVQLEENQRKGQEENLHLEKLDSEIKHVKGEKERLVEEYSALDTEELVVHWQESISVPVDRWNMLLFGSIGAMAVVGERQGQLLSVIQKYMVPAEIDYRGVPYLMAEVSLENGKGWFVVEKDDAVAGIFSAKFYGNPFYESKANVAIKLLKKNIPDNAYRMAAIKMEIEALKERLRDICLAKITHVNALDRLEAMTNLIKQTIKEQELTFQGQELFQPNHSSPLEWEGLIVELHQSIRTLSHKISELKGRLLDLPVQLRAVEQEVKQRWSFMDFLSVVAEFTSLPQGMIFRNLYLSEQPHQASLDNAPLRRGTKEDDGQPLVAPRYASLFDERSAVTPPRHLQQKGSIVPTPPS